MHENIRRRLLQQGLIDPDDAEKIARFEAGKPFSLHWELKTLLYLGVLLLNVGLGYIVYENIDSIGHTVIILLIGALSAACFWYAIRHRQPFSKNEVESPTPYFDYILLLGCLAFLVMEGYWQYQYQLFGTRYGLATFIPMVLFFGLAYWFDNRGVLALALTALASWLGLTLAPQNILTDNDFNSAALVNTGIFLGVLLATLAFVSERMEFKKHFSATYLNFGVHILMISCLAGMMSLDVLTVYFPLLCLAAGFFLWYARSRGSFYFLLVAVLYGYIGFTYLFFSVSDSLDFTVYLLYFILSCGGILVFLTQYKRFFKKSAA